MYILLLGNFVFIKVPINYIYKKEKDKLNVLNFESRNKIFPRVIIWILYSGRIVSF